MLKRSNGNVNDTITFSGAGNTTIGAITALGPNGNSGRFVTLTFNQSGTATLTGANNINNKANSGGNTVANMNNGTTVLDNSGALNSARDVGVSFTVGSLTASGNNVNLLLGDANNLTGGITIARSFTVQDADTGTITLGGQNTSGVNTFSGNFTLGSTANTGKSVTLIAATGGEVDFTGAFLINGTDTSAGITVNDGAHAGTVKLSGANTYPGSTTISAGTLQLGNNNVLPSGTTLNRTGGTVDMNGKNNTVNAFQVSGTVKAKGTWGSTASAATHKNNTYFTSASAGVLTVTTGGATTTTLAAGGTSTYGDSVAFTATVVGSGGDGATPSGTVTFYDNGTPIGTGSLSGSGLTATATLNYTALAAGTHNNLTAAYGGSDSYDVSTTASAITQVVNPLAVQLTGNRVYDGTATAAAAILSVGNKVGSDTVTVASGSGTLASANGGLQTITDFSGLTLGNNAAGNYTLTSASGSVRINPAPVGSFVLATTKNHAVTFNAQKLVLLAGDAGVTLSVTAVTSPSIHGTVVLNGDNTITYTPATDYTNTDSFTYTLSDNVGGSSVGTVSVTVNEINAVVLSIAMVEGVPTVTASGIPNHTYNLQYSEDLGSSWSQLTTITAAANGVISYADTDYANHAARMFRLAE